MSSSHRLIKALTRQPVDSTPVWFMRQAGRYLPEYRQLRQNLGSFLAMCKNPEIACQITLQPLQRFDLDAAIIFSDILVIPDAMNLGLGFKENEGPFFAHPIRDKAAIDNLPIPDPEDDLGYVMKAIQLMRQSQSAVPLIGFCGSPWTVATYMVEGKSSRNFACIKSMLYNEPTWLHSLLAKISLASCHYLHAQINHGAQVVMIFDTWGGVLANREFSEFSLRYMQNIVSYLKSQVLTCAVPIILFTKHGGQWLELLAATGCDGLGIDWTVDISQARERVGHRVALQGNLDPAVLYASPERIQTEVKKVLAGYGHGTGHVFNLGHGIHPEISPEKVQVMIETVRQYSLVYHQKEKIYAS